MGTPNYNWDHIATNQAAKEVTANGTFDAIDVQVKANADAIVANDAAAEHVANKNVAGGYPGFVAAPATSTSTGTKGSIAMGNDGGSPPLLAVFFCLDTDTWLRIASDGTTSDSF